MVAHIQISSVLMAVCFLVVSPIALLLQKSDPKRRLLQIQVAGN